jgi:hypothetical protein
MVEVKKFLWRSAGNDAARFKQDDARSKEKSFAKIVSDKNDRLSKAARQCAEFTLKLRARDGVERTERFVHQENRRIGGECAGDADALALASGKFAGMAMREFARIEADKVEHLLDARGDASCIPAFEARNEAHIFRNGEMGEQASVLNHVTDAAA